MAGDLKLKQGSSTTLVSSGASITSGNASAVTATLPNSTNLDELTTFRLVAAAGSAPMQGSTVSLYLVPVSDGTNAAGVDASTPYFNPNYFVGNFVWPAASSAASQKMDIDGVPLSAIDYVGYLVNNLGQTLSSTWSLTSYPTRGQYT